MSGHGPTNKSTDSPPREEILEAGLRPQTILRLPAVKSMSGLSRSSLYNRIADGLWPRQVNLGGRAVGWPSSEVVAVTDARIAGKSNEEVRQLITAMEKVRRGPP